MQNFTTLIEDIDLSLFRIFNGVNHPVNLYHLDFQQMTSISRKGDVYELINKDYQPYHVIPKMQQLSLDSTTFPGLQTKDICFEYPKTNTPRPLPETVRDYDVIIVSKMYAEDALFRGDYDLLDRLYTVGPAVQYNRSTVGTISLRKVCPPLGGSNYQIDPYSRSCGYVKSYSWDQQPSLAAVLQWLNYCASTNMHDPYYQSLCNYAMDDIRHRKGILPRRIDESTGMLIFNV